MSDLDERIGDADFSASHRDRVTVVTQFHHEQRGESPRSFSLAFADALENTEEEAYSRRCKVGQEWKPLDLGWFGGGDVSYIVIENLVGRHFDVNPTEREKAELAARVLELTSDESAPAWLIRPRRHFYGECLSPGTLKIRCQSGEGVFRVTAIPK